MSLIPRCSSPHLCTPAQRTEGGSGVGMAVGDIPAVAVATGVAEETTVSAARSSPDENCKGSAMKAGRSSRDRVKEHCFILPAFRYAKFAIRVRFDSQGLSQRLHNHAA